jgi:hypothetical protein
MALAHAWSKPASRFCVTARSSNSILDDILYTLSMRTGSKIVNTISYSVPQTSVELTRFVSRQRTLHKSKRNSSKYFIGNHMKQSSSKCLFAKPLQKSEHKASELEYPKYDHSLKFVLPRQNTTNQLSFYSMLSTKHLLSTPNAPSSSIPFRI